MIDTQSLPFYWLLGSGGAFALEAVRLYDMYGKLAEDKFRSVVRDFWFWVVSAGVVLVSGFIAWAALANYDGSTPLPIVATGIAARSIVRDTARAKLHGDVELGSKDDEVTPLDRFG